MRMKVWKVGTAILLLVGVLGVLGEEADKKKAEPVKEVKQKAAGDPAPAAPAAKADAKAAPPTNAKAAAPPAVPAADAKAAVAPPAAPPAAADPAAEAAPKELRELLDLSDLHFYVYVKALGDDDPSSEVFGDGEVSSLWLCADEQSGLCFFDSQYADRITFEFFYYEADKFVFESGRITLLNESSFADAKIISFSHDPVALIGEFTVEYNCVAEGDVRLSVDFPFVMKDEGGDRLVQGISFAWVKHCPSKGAPPNVRFGYIDPDLENSHVYFDSAMTKLRVGEFERNTIIFLELLPPENVKSFQTPIVEVSNDKVVKPELTHVNEKMIYSNEPTLMQILYYCKKKEEALITLRIPIPPFEELSATWVKDCSGTMLKTVKVYSKEFLLWSQGEPEKPATITVPAEENDVVLTVRNDADGETVQFGSVTLIPDQHSIVHATVESPTAEEEVSGHYLRAGSSVLPSGKDGLLKLHFSCRAAGITDVAIIFSPRKYESIDIKIVKVCSAPAPRRRVRSVWRTAGKLFNFLLFIFCAFGAFAFAMNRRGLFAAHLRRLGGGKDPRREM